MVGQSGIKGFLGAGVQASGDLTAALVARSRFVPFVEAEFTESRNEQGLPSSRRAEVSEFALDRYDLRLDATLEPTTEGPITMLAKSLLGASASAAEGGTLSPQPYKHTITLADTVPAAGRVSLEKRFGTLNEAEASNFIANRLRFDFAQEGFARWQVGAIGSKPERVATATTPTLPTVTTLVSRIMGTIDIAGVTNVPVRSGHWEITRPLDEGDFSVNSQFRRDAQYRGPLEATWEVQLLFENMDWLRRFWDSATATQPGTESKYYDAKLSFKRPDVIAGTVKHTIEAHLPRSFIRRHQKRIPGSDMIVQTLRGEGTYDTATTKAVDVVIINTVSTA